MRKGVWLVKTRHGHVLAVFESGIATLEEAKEERSRVRERVEGMLPGLQAELEWRMVHELDGQPAAVCACGAGSACACDDEVVGDEKTCETCEYEDVLATEEPCRSCLRSADDAEWKAKEGGEV